MFKALDTIFSPTLTYDTPRIYNLLVDPGETTNVRFPYTWVPQKATPALIEHAISLQKFPPIKPGKKDPYTPSK